MAETEVSGARHDRQPAIDHTASRILAFLERIGIRVVDEPVPADTFLPDIAIRDGMLVVDLARLRHAGDLLHEAGHIAVTDPAVRPTLCEVRSDGGEEMAAIGWSYAAALAAGVDPRIVFHNAGYQGGGAHLARTFAGGGYIGLPLLQWFGLTYDAASAAKESALPYPHMQRWLR